MIMIFILQIRRLIMEKSSNFPKVMQLVNARVRNQTQAVWCQRPFSQPLCILPLCSVDQLTSCERCQEEKCCYVLVEANQQVIAGCIHIALSFYYVICPIKFSRKLILLLQMIKLHPSHSFNNYLFILQSYMYNNRDL